MIPDLLFEISPRYRPLFAALGLSPQSIFTDPRIVAWRSITERENCTLDASTTDGPPTRFHVKRFHPSAARVTPAEDEARGIRLLESAGIPTPPLVAWGRLPDRRSFVITEDLAGYRAADKLIADGHDFEQLLNPTADLAAKLHRASLHHRDLYLCHFFVRPDPLDIKLIDAARVRQLPTLFTRRRWIIKDLAQFWYSTTALNITEDQRHRWVARYQPMRNLTAHPGTLHAIQRKSAAIARHDEKLKAAQPTRNVSIPGA